MGWRSISPPRSKEQRGDDCNPNQCSPEGGVARRDQCSLSARDLNSCDNLPILLGRRSPVRG